MALVLLAAAVGMAAAIRARAIANYDARTPNELSITFAEPLIVDDSDDTRSHIKARKENGEAGLVPSRQGLYAIEGAGARERS